jgi:hypothetical protein
VIDKESLKIEILEQVLIENVSQLFRNLLESQNGLTITRITTPIINRVGSSLKMR